MHKRTPWMVVAPVALVAVPPAWGVQYLSLEQAQQQMFPAGSRFEPVALTADAAPKERIAAAGAVMSNIAPRAWLGRAGNAVVGYFFAHEVLGKQELISYAVAIDAEGKVRGVEILAYRESHGYEVRNPRWRAQFSGKGASDPLRLDSDIANISGATLSCRHLTDGVRYLVAMHQAVLSARP